MKLLSALILAGFTLAAQAPRAQGRRRIGRGAAMVTLNGSYHFLRGKGRFEPFVSGGYGAWTNFGDSVSLFNCGGGGRYWFTKRLGFRAEVLNFQHSQYRELTSIRFGLAFR